jgi:protocatechuate 3,4-dioxygenase alpha subunit
VFDGAGEPIRDAMIETWQSNPPAGSGFRAFTRAATDDDGRWAIRTLRPGGDTPFLDVSVFARGMLHRCVTRIYFADEAGANSADPVLATVPEQRRGTLLAQPADGGYRFDIHLQGPSETVFFDV